MRAWWSHPVGGAVAALAAAVGVAWLLTPGDVVLPVVARTAAAVAGAAVVSLTWWATTRVPRCPPGRTGLVLSVACENDEQEKIFRADFVDTFRRLVYSDEGRSKFALIEYPQRLAAQIKTAEDAHRLRRRSRAPVIMWGRVRHRTMPDGNTGYVVDLTGGVQHADLTPEQQDRFRRDISEAWPAQAVIPTQGSIAGFATTSELLDVAARYAVGLAALVSHYFQHAESLFLSVEERLPANAQRFPPLRNVAKRLPANIARALAAQVQIASQRFRTSRDLDDVREMEAVVDRLLARNPNDYAGLLNKAICQFLLHGDVKGAKKTISQCRQQRDPTWRYSLAFLHAYAGSMSTAREEYTRAFNGKTTDPTLPVQCEEFIKDVLAREPDKVQLHFCSGLINHYAKQDPKGARHDFERFLTLTSDTQFAAQRAEAKAILVKLPAPGDDDLEGATEIDYQLRPKLIAGDD